MLSTKGMNVTKVDLHEFVDTENQKWKEKTQPGIDTNIFTAE